MNSKNSKRVISVCTLEHKEVWKLTSRLLPTFIEADEFIVYVPEHELVEFKKITNTRIQVLSEESLECRYKEKLLFRLKMAKNESRFGWYFQQFLKIEALEKSPTDFTIIWDADCVPVSNIELFSDTNKPKYLKATEFHEEYFKLIHRLLGLKRIQDFSYIIPGFPMRKSWVSELLNEIQIKNPGFAWHEAIINKIDFTKLSGFSEFETLGTWLFNKHPADFEFADYRWERFGQSRFGMAKDLSPENILEIGKNHNLSVISFENWDKKLKLKYLNEFIFLIYAIKPKVNQILQKLFIVKSKSN